MRKLETSDVFAFCRCIKKIGVKEHVRKIAQEADTVKDVWNKGFELMWELFDTATEKNGEAILYEFFSGPFEMTVDEVAHLHIDELINKLQQLAEENNLTVFFRSAAKSMR